MTKFIIKSSILLALGCLHLSILASNSFGPYQAKILSVKEGDTLFAEVEIWPGLYRHVYIRLKGIDTAEPAKVKGGRSITTCEQKASKLAIKFVRKFIKNAASVEISNVNQIKSTSNYVFARISVDGKDLGQALVKNKHAILISRLKNKRWSCKIN